MPFSKMFKGQRMIPYLMLPVKLLNVNIDNCIKVNNTIMPICISENQSDKVNKSVT
jgi:hypothetical protein